ncbi:haloacid dehalogenase type II [Saccharopolyspora griseoalba]|uniref:Haloacid dehalogenase type II n=1 Tax=Saccharopolyspora griseoalba TaxID=1431848 RepID=A0ABW2LCC9_9PSEU
MSLDVPKISALVLDVLGTIVDERGHRLAETRSALEAAGESAEPADALVDAWLDRIDELMPEAGGQEFRPMDELNREALDAAAESAGAALRGSALDDLAAAALVPRPWPDAAPGLGALAERFNTVALSNSTARALIEIARGGGLRWHAALPTELVRCYKPDPAAYRLVLDLLRAGEGEVLMVAAHPWDLRAAAAQGMRTAYVKREGCPDADGEFDVESTSLAALAAELLATE